MPNITQYIALKNFSRLPSIAQRLATGQPIHYQGHKLNPTMQFILSYLNGRQFEGMMVSEARKLYRKTMTTLMPTRIPMKVTNAYNISVDGDYSGELTVFRYTPKNVEEPMPTIYYLHGGGLVIGSVSIYDNWLRWLANATGCCIYALDYRKGPEKPYPYALEDTIAGWRWIHSMAEEHDLDTARIAVMGDSGGGTLAALLCQQSKARSLPTPQMQCLLYPAPDFENNFSCVERLKNIGIHDHDLRWMRNNYLLNSALASDPNVSPLNASDELFMNSPETIISTAGFDPLHEQGQAYAIQLLKHRTKVTEFRHVHFLHGYLMFLETIPAVRKAIDEIVSAIRSSLNVHDIQTNELQTRSLENKTLAQTLERPAINDTKIKNTRFKKNEPKQNEPSVENT